jgi:hypothetical protein
MYSPSFAEVPSAAAEALRLLHNVLVRCAAVGELRVDPDVAAQTIMSANIGVALSLVTQPRRYMDPDLSRRVRDAVHAALLVNTAPPTADAVHNAVGTSAAQLHAALEARSTTPPQLTEPETALLRQWLATLAQAPPASAEDAGVPRAGVDDVTAPRDHPARRRSRPATGVRAPGAPGSTER